MLLLLLVVWQVFRAESRRKRWGKVKTSCVFTAHTTPDGAQTGPATLVVEAVNHGPGEATICALKGRYKDGQLSNIDLRSAERKLTQGDRITRVIMPLDERGGLYDGFYNDEGSDLVDLWFEDTYGRKHRPKRVRRYLRDIRGLA